MKNSQNLITKAVSKKTLHRLRGGEEAAKPKTSKTRPLTGFF